jgi:hypothetical protein
MSLKKKDNLVLRLRDTNKDQEIDYFLRTNKKKSVEDFNFR